MNRQLRRANEKSDKKKDREKQRRRKERIAARQSARTSPKPVPKKSEGKGGTRMPGRWAGPLAIATIAIVLMGAILPQEQTKVTFIIDLAYYLLFGYFASLWLLRRKTQNALFLATLGGFLLGAIVELANLYRPGYEWQPLILLLSIPTAFLGALLGRTLYRYG